MLEAVGVGTPILVHFDEELEENLLLEEVLDVLACLRADALEGRTGFADDDAFLGIAFAVDDCVNANEFVLFLEGFYFYFNRVRDLFVVVLEDLLADDLVDKEACGLVGQLVFREERRTFGKCVFYSIKELRDTETLLCRNRENLGFRQLGVPESNEGLKGLLCREINFVNNKGYLK